MENPVFDNFESVSSSLKGKGVTQWVFVSDKSSRASTLLAQCRTNLPSRTDDITTPAWRLVIYHPAANLHYVWRTVETVENTVCTLHSDIPTCVQCGLKVIHRYVSTWLFWEVWFNYLSLIERSIIYPFLFYSYQIFQQQNR